MNRAGSVVVYPVQFENYTGDAGGGVPNEPPGARPLYIEIIVRGKNSTGARVAGLFSVADTKLSDIRGVK